MSDETPAKDAPDFDWVAIVEATRPDDATRLQRIQALRLRQTLARLQEWAAQTRLGATHAGPAAAFAVVSSQPTTPDALTDALARLFLWIFNLDSSIDDQPADRLGDPAWVDAVLRACAQSMLARISPIRPEQAIALGWAPLQMETTPAPDDDGGDDWPARLSAAASVWLDEAVAEWKHARHAAQWERILVEQLLACVGLMRQEFAWSALYRTQPTDARKGKLPTLDAYLDVAARTTGVHPAATLVCARIGPESEIWAHAQP
ncbi:MAG TPA: hypothetical protein VKQ36_03840, partial [Ktedonobacterales bacterium]|nr:hypothetical protein [Ktedonobacterales bacterium]